MLNILLRIVVDGNTKKQDSPLQKNNSIEFGCNKCNRLNNIVVSYKFHVDITCVSLSTKQIINLPIINIPSTSFNGWTNVAFVW